MCHLFWWIGQGGHFYSLFDPKNTNLVEDVKIFFPVKFRWILFSCFRGKVKICISQSEARAAILFFRSAQKTNLVEDVRNLTCFLSSFSTQWFHRRSQKCLSQSEAGAAILFFRLARKTQTWYRALRSCFLSSFVEFRSTVSEENLKMSQQIRD